MSSRRSLWFVAILVVASAGGCSSIMVRPAVSADGLDDCQENAVNGQELSPRSLQTLRCWDLAASYYQDPTAAYKQLHAVAAEQPRPELLFALAELTFLLGHRAEKANAAESCAYYYLCAGYAHHFLFDTGLVPVEGPEQPHAAQLRPLIDGERPFDPRFRMACALYNSGLAKCIHAAQKAGTLDPRQALHLPTADGTHFVLSVQHHGFPWQPEEFGPLLFCRDYEVIGLANRYRTYGLGVPLIGTRAATAPKAPGEAFYPKEASFPVSAFLRFEGSVADLSTKRCGQLELYNPLAMQTVNVQGRPVPLETDLTTPLAFFLSRTDLQGLEVTGFLRPDKLESRSGIYLFEPYQPGKIPVLMVHGLLSSPLTWSPVFNDLRADPAIRDRYQFWFYLYPTGSPYLEAAADLREDLASLRKELDPGGCDSALDQMVLVGHSMGGLVSKLLTTNSDDDFWKIVSREPLEALKAPDANKTALRRVFFFEQQPCIKRVVFIGTPHRGSALSPSIAGKLATRFVQLPKMLRDANADLLKVNPTLRGRHLPTSVDLLAPEAPALTLLAARPRPAEVHFHSIIGQAPPCSALREVTYFFGGDDERGDGVVPYASAHLDGVDSEIVVPADHLLVHHHPRAVLEVRRILLEHLRQLSNGEGSTPATEKAE